MTFSWNYPGPCEVFSPQVGDIKLKASMVGLELRMFSDAVLGLGNVHLLFCHMATCSVRLSHHLALPAITDCGQQMRWVQWGVKFTALPSRGTTPGTAPHPPPNTFDLTPGSLTAVGSQKLSSHEDMGTGSFDFHFLTAAGSHCDFSCRFWLLLPLRRLYT